jgi:thiol-disulfide isomerase/thioredoxin
MRRRDFISALAISPLSPGAFDNQAALQEGLLLNRRVGLDELRVQEGSRPLDPLSSPVTILHFWGDECGPCVAEMPIWRHICETMHGQQAIRFAFLGETYSEKRMRRFLSTHADAVPRADQFLIPYGDTASHLPGQRSLIRSQLENDVQPLTLLLDRERAVRQAFVGSVQGRLPELENSWNRLAMLAQGRPPSLVQAIPSLAKLTAWAGGQVAPTPAVRKLELALLHHQLPTDGEGAQVRLLYPREQRTHGDESWLRSLSEGRKYHKLHVKSGPWVGSVPGLLLLDQRQTVRQAFLGTTHRTRAPEVMAALDRFLNVV